MEASIRWGILGTGIVAGYFAEGLRSLEGARLMAVGSRDRERAENFARRHGSARACASYEEVAELGDVDVIYIATRNDQHRDNCLLCLGRGKPVLCEKPFAMNAGEAHQVVEMARAKKLFCMEGMWMRFMPAVIRLRSLLREGAVGDIKLITANLGFSVPYDPATRFYNPVLGGGVLLDLGVYPVSLAHFLLGSPNKIASRVTLAPSGVDEQAAIVLEFPDRRLAAIETSFCTQLPGDAWVFGTHGRIRMPGPLYRPSTLWLWSSPSPSFQAPDGVTTSRLRRQLGRVPAMVAAAGRLNNTLAAVLRRPRRIREPYQGNGYSHEAIEVMRCLREGHLESANMSLDETLSIMETLDAVRTAWTS